MTTKSCKYTMPMAAIIQHAQCATYPQALHGTCMEVHNTFAEYIIICIHNRYSQLYVYTILSNVKHLNLPMNSMTTKQVHWHIQYNHSSRQFSPILKTNPNIFSG